MSSGCKATFRVCERSFVGTELKRMLVFAEKVICLRDLWKI
jgi:hypothetical protein